MATRREFLVSGSAGLALAGLTASPAHASGASALLRELSDYAVQGFGNVNRPVAQRITLATGVVDARFDTNRIGYNAVSSFYNPRNPRLRNTQADVARFTNEYLPKFRVQIVYNLADLFEGYDARDFRIDGESNDASTGQVRVNASYRPVGVARISTSWWFSQGADGLRIQNIKLGPFNIINEARSRFTSEFRSGGWDQLFRTMDRDAAQLNRNLLKGSKAG